MEPATIGLIISLIASAISAGVQHQNARAAEDQAEINAKREREAAEAAAEQERLTRSAEAKEEARESAQRQSRLRAQIATSGVEFDGTPNLLMTEQAANDEYNIQSRNQDSLIRRRNLRYGGRLAYAQGSATAKAYGRQANSALITGTANMAATGVSYSSQRGWLD